MNSLRQKSSFLRDSYPIFFQLSGVHENLPKQEILAILEGEEYPYKVIENGIQYLIANTSLACGYRIAFRASYCRRSVRILQKSAISTAETISTITSAISREIDFTKFFEMNETFLVRVYRIGKASNNFLSTDLESSIGKVIWQQTKGKNKANMKKPDIVFVLVFYDESYIFGQEIYSRQKGAFDERQANLRPFFKPGTLEPRFARLMVNLAKINNKSLLLDPFCGPGGILVEGGLMGCELIGSDLDSKMVYGAQKNLQHYLPNLSYSLFLSDARDLPFTESIHSIATDPPYGKSTSTFGKGIEDLLKKFFEEAHKVLIPGGIISIGMLSEVPLQQIVEETGYKLELYEKMYIHKSLTRRVGVCRKV
ncbi:MAG: THUMP domain-containing protein [Candidatus Heimdallarchaeota archaeon]